MLDLNDPVHPEGAVAGNLFRGMMTGMLPGVLLCTVLVAGLKNSAADAAMETYLTAQDITLSGKVTAPSCTVKLENDHVSFTRSQNTQRMHDPDLQIMRLNLSQCEVDGLGMKFKAEHWSDNPVRGALRGKQSQQHDGTWYYTISPGTDNGSDIVWPLHLVEDSPVPEMDKQSGDNNRAVYFSLAEVNYWYDLNTPLKASDVLSIPFAVQAHHLPGRENNSTGEELESNFTLQLSWR